MDLTEINKRLEAFEGDKRTKEYKELKELKESLETPQIDLDREKLLSLGGVIKKEDVEWFFNLYNKKFNTNQKPCNCPGKVRVMVNKLVKSYEY